MDKKILFNEALTSLVEFSAANGNEITPEDVKVHFKDLIDDESQYSFIYDYLAANKIKVKGFKADTSIFSDALSENENNVEAVQLNNNESEEELAFIQMYMDDLEGILPMTSDEKEILVSKLIEGDVSVTDRLVEAHLSLVADIAKKYRGKGVTFGDLIQEGNIGLLLALSDYHPDCGNFDEFITTQITNALETTINSQINSDRINQHLADKLNQLDTVTKDLNEKLGRVPDTEELASAMNITSEEVSLLLKTSLDTLSVNEDTQITSDDNEAEDDLSYTTPTEDPLKWRVNKK